MFSKRTAHLLERTRRISAAYTRGTARFGQIVQTSVSVAGDNETHQLRESEALLISSCCFQASKQLVFVVRRPSSSYDISVEIWPSLMRFAHFGASKKSLLSEHQKVRVVFSEK